MQRPRTLTTSRRSASTPDRSTGKFHAAAHIRAHSRAAARICIHLANGDAAALLNRVVCAGTHDSEKRSAVSRSFLRRERGYPLVQTRPPSVAARTGSALRLRTGGRNAAYAHPFDDVEPVLLAITNAFDDRPNQIGARVFCGEPDPRCSRGRVQVGRSLTHQIGKPVQALRSKLRCCGFLRSSVGYSAPAMSWLRIHCRLRPAP